MEEAKNLPPSNLPTPQSSTLPLFYLVFIIAVAFSLRLANLNDLPLSLSLDEAVDGLDAVQLFRLSWITPFLQNNFGRETLFFYVQGLVLWLGGISVFSLRFASVLAGTLTIPLLYRVGQQLALERSIFNVQSSTAKAASLLAATGLAVSYWHIYFSRVGLRAILLPPVLLGLVYCFWRGWYPAAPAPVRTRLWLIVAGFLLGLTFYIYLAARLLPLLFAIFIGIELLKRSSVRKANLANSLIFGGVTALTIMPLALYFQQNPQALNSRTQAISIFGGNASPAALLDNVLALLRLHFLSGTWLGQWPALDLLPAVGLLVGLPICLCHLRKPACLFLLLWWVIGTAPVLFSTQDWAATTTVLRGIMAWPALYLISAIGLTAISQRLVAWARHRTTIQSQRPPLGHSLFALAPLRLLILPFLLLLSGGLLTIYNYFFIWATTYNNFSDHPPQMARYLNSQTGQLTLTPLQFYAESVVNFLLQAHYPYLRNIDDATLRSFLTSNRPTVYLLPDQSSAEPVFVLLVPAPNGQGTAYLLPPLTPAQIETLAHQTRQTAPLSIVLDREREPIAQVYPLSPDTPISQVLPPEPMWQPLLASFKDDIRLTGYQVEPAAVKPGETITLSLNWQARRPIDGDFYLFIHLFDVVQRQRRGQVNTPLTGVLFNAHRWPAGLTVPGIYHFTLPDDAPDGAYRFEVGLYDASTQQRLPVTIEAASASDQLILGKVHIRQQPPAPPQFPLTDIQFGDSIALMGVDLPPSSLHPGQVLSYNLHWQALAAIPQNYTVFTHLLDAAGTIRAQLDNPPQHGQYPTSWWDPGEIIVDPYTLPLPSDLAPGSYTLRVGLYHPETGKRFPLKNKGQDFVDLPNFIYVSQNYQ